jgi:hypothetical protein
VTNLRFIKFDDETLGVIPLVIETSQLIEGELTNSLRGRLHEVIMWARQDFSYVDFWQWCDDDTLTQGFGNLLRITPGETERFCKQVLGSREGITKEHLIVALVSASTVIGVVYKNEEEIYITGIDGAGYGYVVKNNSYMDPAFKRVIAKSGDLTSSPHPVEISMLVKPGHSNSDLPYEYRDLAYEYGAWTATYCNLRGLRLEDFLDNFACFEEC